MSSESMLLLELSGSPPAAAAGALLDDPFCGESGNPPGVTVAAFASSVANSARSCCALFLASFLAASSIVRFSFTGALRNRACSSLAHCG